MGRWTISAAVLLLACRIGAGQTAEDVRTSFRVRYVGSDSVYLEGGRSAGLEEGMKLVIVQSPSSTASPSSVTAPVAAPAATGASDLEPWIIAKLTVTAVAETSAACEIVSTKRAIVVGDIARLTQEATEKLVERRVLSNTRQYPAVVSFTEGDPLDEDVREAVPRPPLPEVNRATGRIGFDYSGISNRGRFASSSSLMAVVLRAEITRINGTFWNLNGYWRGLVNTRSSTSRPTLQELMNRTYHLSLTYANPNSKWVAGFGRMYLPWASSLETLDGGYFGRRLSRLATAGIFGGTTPDPTSWSYNPNRRMAGTFLNFDGGSYDGLKYSTTIGAGLSTIRWQVDRPFAFTETNVAYKRVFSIYSTVQVDRPRIADPTLPHVGVGIGRSYLSLRVQIHPRVTLDFNHSYFRDVPTFDAQLVGTGLLDKYLFQGISGGVRAEMPRHVTLYVDLGRSDSNQDTRSSWNTMMGATVAQIWRTGLQADIRYSKFNSAFAQGSYQTFSVSRNFGEGFRGEIQVGRQSFFSPFTRDTGSHFLNANVDLAVRVHYFLEGGFTFQRGALQNYDQWHLGLGYRFDNRKRKQPRKEATVAAKP